MKNAGLFSKPILLDVSRLVWRAWERKLPTGIDRTCLAYVAHFRERAQAIVQRGGFTQVLSTASSQELFDAFLNGAVHVRRKILLNMARGMFRKAYSFQDQGHIYINVGHTGVDKPSHQKWIQKNGIRTVYFIHDLIPLTHPEYCRPGEAEKHERRVMALLRHGAGIAANSQHTIKELSDFAVGSPEGSLPLPPLLVAPLGAEISSAPGEEGSGMMPRKPYFVMLGTIEGRKNHLLILNVWAALARRLGPACPQLIIIGQRGWECEQVVDMLERCEPLQGHVNELSHCDDRTLSAYMRGARALLFPSFVEGYGLPLVEALSFKTPVIASDLAVFRELAGDVPDYLSPIDGLGWMAAIEDYAQTKSGRRAGQLGRMAEWTPPSWKHHFALVDGWLEQISS